MQHVDATVCCAVAASIIRRLFLYTHRQLSQDRGHVARPALVHLPNEHPVLQARTHRYRYYVLFDFIFPLIVY